MTWEQFKLEVERQGVQNDDYLDVICVNGTFMNQIDVKRCLYDDIYIVSIT